MGDLISTSRPEPKREAAAPSHDGGVEADEKLSAEDLERVARYLRSPVHQVERKPFRPWLMMLLLLATVGALSLLSLFISWLVL